MFLNTRANKDTWTGWSTPVNLGKYVNTIHNDEGYKMSPLENYAYFDSDNKENGKDIFKLRIPKLTCEPEIKRVKVEDLDNYPLDSIKVLAIDPCDNENTLILLVLPFFFLQNDTARFWSGNSPGILRYCQEILHQLRITNTLY